LSKELLGSLELNRIYQMDCLDGMKLIPDKSVDLIIADPPYYKIVKEDWDNQWKNENEYIEWCLKWTNESFRILKEGGLLYVWGAIGKHKEHPFLKYIFEVENKTEFTFLNFITMRNFRVFGNSKHFPFGRQELVVFSKGKHITYHKQYTDFEGTNRLGKPKLVTNIWLDCKDVSLFNKKNAHPTEKPELSSERIILSSSNEGDIIVVPFSGSGVDCMMSKKHNRKFIAFETNPEYIKIGNIRLESVYNEIDDQKILKNSGLLDS